MSKIKNLSDLDLPAFLMNFPTSFSAKEPNNVWMDDLSKEDLIVDQEVAMAPWMDLYNLIGSSGICQILPTPIDCSLQDLVFTANLGVCLSHEGYRDQIILSNFTTKPRIGEENIGYNHFISSGYTVHHCPHKFEGEAELKHLKDNIYVGGYGQRTEIETYNWMEKTFDMKIIKVKSMNPKLYHFDCVCFPITEKAIMLASHEISKESVKELEEVMEIIHVPSKYATAGVTNNVRLHNLILNSSDINDIDAQEESEDFELERDKNLFLEDIAVSLGMEPIFVNLSEYMKGGALLSCMVMHLNRFSYKIELM